ncbi:putative holin [Pectobacterium sp. 21LCBS03]
MFIMFIINKIFPNRLRSWILLSVLLLIVIALVSPAQLSVTIYKLSLVSVAVVLGYHLDQALFPYASPGSYLIYDVSIDHVSLSNIKNQALFAKDVRFLSVDRLFASSSAGNLTTNTNFVEITPTVTCPELSRITLTGQYNTGGFAGAVLWNNTGPIKARRSMMRCVELGSGKPASLD